MATPNGAPGDGNKQQPDQLAWFEKLATVSDGAIDPAQFESGAFIEKVNQASVGDFLKFVVARLGVVKIDDYEVVAAAIQAGEKEYAQIKEEYSIQEFETTLGLTGAEVPEGAILDVGFFALRETLQDRWGVMYEGVWNEAHRFARFVVGEAILQTQD